MSNEDTILLYIDNSNLFIPAMKLQVTRNRSTYSQGVTQDGRVRLNYVTLVNIICGDRNLWEKAKIYISTKNTEDKKWAIQENEKIKKVVLVASQITKKEKRTDTSLVANAVDDMWRYNYDMWRYNLEERSGTKTIVLCTGDEDMMPVFEIANNLGFKVEVWAFDSPLSGEIKRSPNVTRLQLIDEYFTEGITYFIDLKWKYGFDDDKVKERTLVLRFLGTGIVDMDEALVRAVNIVTKELSQPVQGVWIEETTERKSLAIVLLHHPNFKSEKPDVFRYTMSKDVLPYKESIKRNTGCEEVLEYNDFGLDGFNRVKKKKEKQECEKGFRCLNFNDGCEYKHTDKQKEFFGKNPKPSSIKWYKTKKCDNSCNFLKNNLMWHMCAFYHHINECYCTVCKSVGHEYSKCPSKLSKTVK